MKAGQRTHHDGHRHLETDNKNPRRVKRTMSLEETHSIHKEGKAEFNNTRSESTVNRREYGITREVIERLESMQSTLKPSPSRPHSPDPPPSSSTSISHTAYTLPPTSPNSSLTMVVYDDDAFARPASLRRRLNQEQEARNYGTKDDAKRGLSYSKAGTIPPIPPPHRVSVK